MKRPLTYELGKLPPQDIDAEKAIIGAALLSTYDVKQALLYIPTAKFFYKEAHQIIWQAILDLFQKSEGIDIITITKHIRTQGKLELIGGPTYITQLSSVVSSSAHLQEYCLIIKQEYIKRELMILGSKIAAQSTTDTTDAFELLAEARQGIENIANDIIVAQEEIIQQAAKNAVNSAAERMGKPVGNIFISTGVPDFDRKMGGYAKNEPDLVILGGRPGMGKSSVLAYEIAHHITHNIPVGIVTLEMSTPQLTNRILVALSEGQIDNTKLKYGTFNKQEYLHFENAASKTFHTPCPIYDRGGLDVRTLRTMALQWKEKYEIQLLYIDYLQLLRYGNERDALKRNTEISINLKILAKELNNPIIALASLNRAADGRSDHRPNLSDLRESGQIELDADVVKFLLRPHHYDKAIDYREMTIIVEKNRHGQTGDILTYFDVATNRPVYLPTPSLPTIQAPSTYTDFTQPNGYEEDTFTPF